MTAKVELSRGYTALVDSDVLPALADYSWHASTKASGTYAQASIKNSDGKYRGVLMHRLIMAADSNQIVDHINGDTLDNRRANLRLATPKQNSFNRRASSQYGYSGVKKSGGAWTAMISPDGIDIALGTYQTKQEAAAAYNVAAQAIYGEYARLNPVELRPDLLESIVEMKRKAISRLEREISVLRGRK